ncbi:glycoside hydrolase [Achlya hypogyna]|uniref:glucan endo-1,3-beta-D-glucosidase n=1 Tax=Achlya hypogyna TaxID=1202772 RepID=A0A0A7CMU1_ACHHY|nr:secreted protein [Achlya hypogyna]OQR94257.1 glycoside hydrolase [Achlya hypogyna]
MKVPLRSLVIAATIALLVAPTTALTRMFQGLNYDPFSSSWEGCKTVSQIATEFEAIAKVTDRLRIQSMRCTARILDAAADAGLKVWIGLWTEEDEIKPWSTFDIEFTTLKELVESNTVRNDNVLGVQIGNDALHRCYIQGQNAMSLYRDIVDRVNKVRTYLRSKGLLIPVTAADTIDSYIRFPGLYSIVDVVSVNYFPIWEKVAAADGMNLLFPRWQGIVKQALAAGKPVLLSETGWSTADDKYLVAEASPAAQALYIKDFLSLAERQSINYYYYSAIDMSTYGNLVEQSFGIFDVNLNLKSSIQDIAPGPQLIVTRIFNGDNVLKVDPHNWNALLVEEPASGLRQNFVDELWIYEPNSQMYYSKSSNLCLDAYPAGSGNDLLHMFYCGTSNVNQKWQFTDEGHLKSLNGADQCINIDRTQKNKLGMERCNDDASQKFSMRELRAEPVTITAGEFYLYEWYDDVLSTTDTTCADCKLWFYDPIAQQLKSKSGDKCLDAYLDGNNMIVHVYDCDATNANQKWQFNEVTGQWIHGTRLGLCLDGPNSGKVHLAFCDKSKASQQWTMAFAQ